MSRRPRRNHSPVFKAKVALAAVQGEAKQDTETLLKCYRQPDNETLLAVMSEERRLTAVAAGG